MSNPEGASTCGVQNFAPSGGNARDITVSLLRHSPADVVGFGDHKVFVARSKGIVHGRPLFVEMGGVINDFGYEKGGWRIEKHLRLIANTSGGRVGDIVGFGESGVYIAINNGDGTFQPCRRVCDDFGCSTGWRIEEHPRFMADLTGDGYADILGFANDGVRISRNQRDGTFGPPSLVLRNFGRLAGEWHVSKHLRLFGDSNGNGLPDIYGFGDAGVLISVNNILEGGTFKPPVQVVKGFGYNSGWRIEKHPRFVADLTGDGTGDIIGFGEGGVFVSLNDGHGNFSPVTKVLKVFGYQGGWRVDRHLRLVADVTGSGRGDIVAFGEEGVWVSVNKGDGTFALPTLALDDFGYSNNTGGWRVDRHPRFMADITGNGKADIIGFGEDGVYVSLNEGGGRFGTVHKALNGFTNKEGWSAEMHVRYLANIFSHA